MGLELEKNGKANGVSTPQKREEGRLDRAWLADWMARISDPARASKKKQAVHFILSHWTGDGKTPMSSEDLDKGLRGDQRTARIAQIVATFDLESQDRATAAPKATQSFIVAAYRTDDPDELREVDPIDTKGFLQTSDKSIGMGAPGAERPTDLASVVGQLQRALDVKESQLTEAHRLLVDAARNTSDENHRLRELSWNQQVQNQKLLNEDVTRHMDVEERRMRNDLISRAFIQAMAVAREFIRDKSGVKKTDPLAAMNLKPMQMIGILQMLEPAQKAAIQPVIEEFISTLSKDDLATLAQVPEIAAAIGLPPPAQMEPPKEQK